MQQGIVIGSFLFFMLIVTAIGVFSSLRQRKKSTTDYLVASRGVPAWLAALSAVATNNSGFMFIGLIGYTYRLGLEAIWMALGWIVGDLIAWIWVHPRVRKISGKIECNTIPQLIGTNERGVQRGLIFIGGVIPLIFLGVYAAAQLKAGSTALQTLLGWSPATGAIIGAVIVMTYCFAGGVRASIWTDAAQSLIMIGCMLMLTGIGFWYVGGWNALWENLQAQDPHLVEWLPQNLKFGFLLYFLGMVSGGFGVVGQPHILVRFMAIESVEKIYLARKIYFAWFIPFFMLGISVGLLSRAVLPDLTIYEVTAGLSGARAAEFAMPVMARELLPSVFVGLILAGLFSATMSTADSQILVCSGSVTQDLFPRWQNSYLVGKVTTLLITLMALLVALYAGQEVFAMVLIAWSALGASLGPLLILRLYRRSASTPTAILMIAAALLGVLGWTMLGYDGDIFKLLPGLIAACLAYGVGYLLGWEKTAGQDQTLTDSAEDVAAPAEGVADKLA